MVGQLAREFVAFVFSILGLVLFIGLPVAALAKLARLARSSRSLAGRLFFVVLIVVFVGFTALCVLLACQGPGPPGYNFITGEGIPGPGEFGPTPKNIGKGLELAVIVASIGLALGGAASLLARLARWAVARPPRLARWCRSLAGRLFLFFFIVVLIGFTAFCVWLACRGPGPAGYNVIIGVPQHKFFTGQPGQFGPTWENIGVGLEVGVTVALIGLALGEAFAELARLVRWAVARR